MNLFNYEIKTKQLWQWSYNTVKMLQALTI